MLIMELNTLQYTTTNTLLARKYLGMPSNYNLQYFNIEDYKTPGLPGNKLSPEPGTLCWHGRI